MYMYLILFFHFLPPPRSHIPLLLSFPFFLLFIQPHLEKMDLSFNKLTSLDGLKVYKTYF